MKKQHVQLSAADRSVLQDLVRKGHQSVRVTKRALALLALDRGETLEATAAQLQTTNVSVAKWRNRYTSEGLESALYDKPRSGRPIEIDGMERAKITAVASSQPPDGYARWSLRMIADKAVKLECCKHVSHTEVREILKKT